MKKKVPLKTIPLFLAILTLSVTAAPALAAEQQQIQPRYVYLSGFNMDFSIADSIWGGKTNCYATASAPDSSYTVELHMELQQKDGSWNTIQDWTGTSARRTDLDKTYYVVSGYDYRIKATATVYDTNNRQIESAVAYSTTEHY